MRIVALDGAGPAAPDRRHVRAHASRSAAPAGWPSAAERPRRPSPLDRLAARLRRLRAQLETTETSPAVTAKRHRVAAVRGAYLDALREACARLGVSPPPGGDRARQADIYRAEAALRERGLDVREPPRPLSAVSHNS